MAKTALVTGGAGFIGSHLIRHLICDGWQVRVLDNFSSGSRQNLNELAGDIEVMVGDIRDRELCRKASSGMDSVFHLAAIASVVRSVEDPAFSHDVTLTGTLNMLLAARDSGVRRFVFSSSAAVYGDADIVPTSERQPIQPQSPYAIAKATGEMYCRTFHDLYGLQTVILRYFNVFGPRQSAQSGYAAVIPLFVSAVLSGTSPTIYGDGCQTRDFVYVENVVRANLLAVDAAEAPGETFNIAGGDSIALLDLLVILGRSAGRLITPTYAPGRTGEVRHSRADIARARLLLGYAPTISIAAGLMQTVEAARSEMVLSV